MDKRGVEGISNEKRRRGDDCPGFSLVTPARENVANNIQWAFDSLIPPLMVDKPRFEGFQRDVRL